MCRSTHAGRTGSGSPPRHFSSASSRRCIRPGARPGSPRWRPCGTSSRHFSGCAQSICNPGVVQSSVRPSSRARLLLRRVAVVISLAVAIHAQVPPNPEDVLAKARDKVVQRTERLPNYICVQTVDRKYFKRANPVFPPPSCDDLAAKNAGKTNVLELEGTDRLRLDVKVSGGTEIGAWAGSSHFDDGNVMKLIRGPFGTGGFGTFLTDIFSGSGVDFYFDGKRLRKPSCSRQR